MQGRDGKEYVFVTMNREPYARRTVQAVFDKAVKASGIQ